MLYLKRLNYNDIDTFSLQNSKLEEIFLRLINNENTSI